MELKIGNYEKELIRKGLQMLLNDREKFKKKVSSLLKENNYSNVEEGYKSILNSTLMTLQDIEFLLNKVSNLS